MTTINLTASKKVETPDRDLHLLSVTIDDHRPIVVVATSRAEAICQMFDYLAAKFPDFVMEEVEK